MKSLCFVLLFIACLSVNAQHKSIHQADYEYYKSFGDRPDAFWDSLMGYKPVTFSKEKTCNLNRIVFGWHPYWITTAHNNYHWDLLTHLTYFCYEVNPATGNASTTNGFSTAPAVDAALANNVKVQLCVVLFSDHATFFGSSSSMQTLISNLISLVQSRGIHGVNIDFESVSSTQKTNLTNFMINLCNQMHAAVPGSEVSICLPSVDWGGTFDVAAMNSYVDQFCIMGYDYYYGGSSVAGPTSPTYSFQTNSILNISRSVSYYLDEGVTRSKLVLGLPYYSFDYPTTSSALYSSTTGSGSSRTYKTIRDNSSGYYSAANRGFSTYSYVPYYIYNNGSWRQCHVDDDYSFSKKLDVVLRQNIGGIGIWALGYDDGYQELWNRIQEKLTDCYYSPCQDTIFDMNGPNGKYFDNENYTFTIAPQNATGISMSFSQFDVEANYDTLWIYNGPNTSSPLIGAYTGTNSPGTINSGGQMTLRFKSDGATTNPGFTATYSCSIDQVPPTTLIDAGSGWKTQDFQTTFTDQDNIQLSQRFFQVMDNNGAEWRANGTHGFFNDNFATALHTDWTAVTGTWSVSNGHLLQSDEANANTNIYALVQQTSSYQYLYHWKMYIDGAQTNKRAGFHFFCDRPDSSNRYNSYFVWFRLGATPYIELYKVTNNVFTQVKAAAFPLAAATWYDVKVFFNPSSGLMEVYVDDEFITSWTDSSPWQNGIAISPRTGNSATQFDDVKVYRSRTASETISVGSPSAMVRYQNASPGSPSCRIRSLVTDINHNLSTSSADVNVDWTAPSDVAVSDGTGADVDTSFSLTQISGNWTLSSDPHSGLLQYYYCVGTQPFTGDVLPWTPSAATSETLTGLALTDGEMYYFSVRAENGAGLMSADSASNGQVATLPLRAEDFHTGNGLVIYPNPAGNILNITSEFVIESVKICDLSGRSMLKNILLNANVLQINMESLEPGFYLLFLNEKFYANIVKK